MQECKSGNDLILAEYNTLRNELLNNIDATNQLYMFAFTTISAIYLLAYYNAKPDLYLTAYVILILSRCRILYYHEMTMRISEYIIVFIEKEHSELSWETVASKKYKLTPRTSLVSVLAELQYFSFTITAVMTFLMYWYISGQNLSLNIQNTLSILAIFVVGTLDYKMRFGEQRDGGFIEDNGMNRSIYPERIDAFVKRHLPIARRLSGFIIANMPPLSSGLREAY